MAILARELVYSTDFLNQGRIKINQAFSGATGMWLSGSSTNAILSNYSVNKATGAYSFSVGKKNNAYGKYSATLSGSGNTVSEPYSVIGGGIKNIISGPFGYTYNSSAIFGGKDNKIVQSTYSFIGGGSTNYVSTSTFSAIVGGSGNTTSATYSFIGGGFKNKAYGAFSTVTGGKYNYAKATNSSVLGGSHNYTYGLGSSVVGGGVNLAAGALSSILAGGNNTISSTGPGGIASAIVAGTQNTLSGAYSSILAGQSITSSLSNVAISAGFAIPSATIIAAGAKTAGTAPVAGGTVTVSTSICTSLSMVFVTSQSAGVVGALRAVPGSGSFVVNSSVGGDSGTIAWWILQPA